MAGTAALLWMLFLAFQVTKDEGAGNRYALGIDAIKYGLGSIAAGGAAAALLLAIRRQRHTEEDSADRRVTELYTKAVEQLGHDDAAVRLGGLYALERVAQDNPGQRQTIIDVVCAYLRMPFTPLMGDRPATTDERAASQTPNGLVTPGTEASSRSRDPRQELQVRLTAQRLLTKHLRWDPTADAKTRRWFWQDIALDLTGATLVDWSLAGCRARSATFAHAWFTSPAIFDEATFTGRVAFGGATFASDATFEGATFTGPTSFKGATFTGFTVFLKATFTTLTLFDEATFTDVAAFDGTTFTSTARFIGTTFNDLAVFDEVAFNGLAQFDEATFTDIASFNGATFTDAVSFEGVTFTGIAQFGQVIFSLPRSRSDAAWLPAGTRPGRPHCWQARPRHALKSPRWRWACLGTAPRRGSGDTSRRRQGGRRRGWVASRRCCPIMILWWRATAFRHFVAITVIPLLDR